MKEFVKTVLAVICGIFLMQLIGFIFFFIMVGSMAAVGSGKTVLPRNGVLDLDLSQFTVAEQTTDASFSLTGMSFSSVPSLGLRDAVQGLKAAAADPSVKYVFLRADGASLGTSDAEELRAALLNFRKSGKAVVAYTESPRNGTFYLASAADKIYMTSYHGASAQMTGLAGRMLFLKDVLDKVGVNFQLIRHGKYKSAGEMYIKNAASPENRGQNQAMVNSIWNVISSYTAEGRNIPVEDFDAMVDNLELSRPEDFLQKGMVDELLDREGLLDKLCVLAGVEKREELHLVPFADYVSAKVSPVLRKSNIAIVYADGEIVDGDGYSDMAGDRFVRAEAFWHRQKSGVHWISSRRRNRWLHPLEITQPQVVTGSQTAVRKSIPTQQPSPDPSAFFP